MNDSSPARGPNPSDKKPSGRTSADKNGHRPANDHEAAAGPNDREPGGLSVEVGEEHETDRGWRYEVTVSRGPDRARLIGVTLSWPDHDALSGGAVGPSVVVGACIEVAAAAMEKLPARCDIATLRRLVERFDASVKSKLGR